MTMKIFKLGSASWRELSSIPASKQIPKESRTIPASEQTPKELRTIPSTLGSNVNRRCAFTLIEIIVALVLGTLLLATLMGVLRRSFSEIGVATRDDPGVARLGLLVEQLRRDLTNARKMYVGNNRFELVGFIHRDPSTLIATLRSARVIYEIRQNGTQSLLVRVQTDDARGILSSESFTEAVYLGAINMLVSSNEVRAFSEADKLGLSSVNSASLLNRRDAVPSSVQIVILDQRGRTILDQTFWRERDAS